MKQIKIHMHRHSFRNTSLALATFLLCMISWQKAAAQQLDFDEVQVIAPFEPSISDAFKINFNPSIEDTMQVDINFEYRIFPVQIPVRFNLEPLSAARMRGEPLDKLYRGYVKGGFGNYTTPYLEAFYNTLRSNEYHYGVHVKHISSGGGIEDYAHSGFSDNNINLYGKRFLRNHTLHADINYERNRLHFYGFKPDEIDDPVFLDELEREHYRQTFQFASPSFSVRSNYLDSTKLQHDFRLKYHVLADGYDAMEHKVGFTGSLEKTLGQDPMGFADRQTFHLDMGVDYYNNQNLFDTTNTAIISVAPRFSSSFRDFNFFVGLNATIQADTTSYARFYPLAWAEVNLINNVLFAYASLTGSLSKHNMRDFMLQNPFMETSIPYAFQNNKMEIRGGFKGSISSFASYNISVSRSETDNYPFFVTSFSSPLANRFDVVYDDIKRFNLRTELFSNVGERLKVRFASDYYEYSLENELEAWHEPTIRLSLNLTYNIQNKIIFNAGAFARNSVYARIPDETHSSGFRSEEIHGFHVDASFGVEYRYTRILSVFLNLNNVQNQPFERWYNYPSQRFNVLGGVTYAF